MRYFSLKIKPVVSILLIAATLSALAVTFTYTTYVSTMDERYKNLAVNCYLSKTGGYNFRVKINHNMQ